MANITLKSVKRDIVARPPRMILLGGEKVGKSTFAAGAPNSIFIPVNLEEGVDDLPVAKFPVCRSLDDIFACGKALLKEEHDFETVVLDSASAAEFLVWQAVCAEANVDSIEKVGGGYGKGYAEALLKWAELLELFDALREKGMAVIIIGHTKVKRFDDPERESYDAYQFDIHEKAANMLYRWADSICFAKYAVRIAKEDVGFNKKKSKAISEQERVLCTQKSPVHPGGGRGIYGKLESEIELSWEAYAEAVAEQRKALKAAKK
jgi:hypothetical protein